MPELPEVEIARRRLDAWTRDRTILRARVPESRVLREESRTKVARFLGGRTVAEVQRRGKSMLLRLSREGALHLHLGMSGRVLHGSELTEKPRHVRLELELEDDRVLFDDPRMFGRVSVGPWDELYAKYFLPLGPDPMEDDFTPARLMELLHRSKRPIKVALMEQALIAGIGNIYAAEALWAARIDPTMPARAITKASAKKLHAAIRRSMSEAIERLEAGEKYLSQGGENPFWVYGREGERCPRCRKAKLERFELGGRSTFWCRRCQATGG